MIGPRIGIGIPKPRNSPSPVPIALNAALPIPPVSGLGSRAVRAKTIIGPTTGILAPFIKLLPFFRVGAAFLKLSTSCGLVIPNNIFKNLLAPLWNLAPLPPNNVPVSADAENCLSLDLKLPGTAVDCGPVN